MKHTPGPWMLGCDLQAIITDYRDESGNSAKTNYLRNGFVKTVARVTHPSWMDVTESVANGRLLAAAPELLDVLIDIVNYMDDTAKQDSGAYRSFQRAEEIIAKVVTAP